MKTTVDIPDALFDELKRTAVREKTTMRELIDAALRRFLLERKRPRGGFRLKDGTFGGKGVQPGIREGDWAQLRELIYEGRGG
jgi:hypothetical protein